MTRHHRPARWTSALIALAFLASAATRSAAMAAMGGMADSGAAAAAPHAAHAGAMASHAVDPAATPGHHPDRPSKHCTPDDCCRLCPGACAVTALPAGPVALWTAAPDLRTVTGPSATSGTFRLSQHRQPFPIGPPSRA